MKEGCGPKLLGLVLLAFALAGLWGLFVVWRSPVGFLEGRGPFASFFGAVLGTATAAVFLWAREEWKGLHGLGHALRGEAPADGERASVVGVLEGRTDEVLTAPFSGRRALAYKYAIDRWTQVRQKRAGTNTVVTAYWGEAMVPCELRTATGTVSLLGRPSLEGTDDVIEGDEAYENARKHIADTRLPEAMDPQALTAMTRAPGDEEDRQYEATGGYRKDVACDPRQSTGVVEEVFDLSRWTLRELVYAPGETVCASGTWSSERGGLFRPEEGLRELQLERGNAAPAASRRKSMLGCLGIIGFVLILFQVLLGLSVWIQGM